MNASATSLEGSPTAGRASVAWWLALLLLFGAAHLWEVWHRAVNPDELEHLHAAFCVSRGELPYRDFFEHHSPAIYYVLQPLFWVFGPAWKVLEGGRLLSLACAVGVLVLTARIANRVLGLKLGLPTAALLAATTIFHVKSVELRPDVWAMLLLSAGMVAALDLVKRSAGETAPTWWQSLAPGFLCALASAFTQKSVVPAAGIALGILCSYWMQDSPPNVRRKNMLREAAYFAGGFLIVWGAILGLFAAVGAAGDLWHSTFYQLLIWNVRTGRWDQLRPTLAADLSVWLAGACELLIGVREIRRRETWDSGLGLLYVAVAVCLLSLIVVKATYPQFYLLWFPWLVLLAVRRWRIWIDSVNSRYAMSCLAGGWLAVLVIEGFLIERLARRIHIESFKDQYFKIGDQLTSLFLGYDGYPWGKFALLSLLFAFVPVLIDLVISRSYRRTAVLGLAALGMVYGQLRLQYEINLSQEQQRKHVELVNAHVAPEGTVLDGFTGFGVLRPHAYYFWWINQYSLGLMTPEERGPKLLHVLQAKPPSAVLFDEHLRKLPPEVIEWLESHYRPADEPLWLPR